MEYLVEDLDTWNTAFGAWGACGCNAAPVPSKDYKGLVTNPSTGPVFSSRTAYSSHPYDGIFDNIREWWQARGTGDRTKLIERIRAWREARAIRRADANPITGEALTAYVTEGTEPADANPGFLARLRANWADRERVDPGTREEWIATGLAVAPALIAGSGSTFPGMTDEQMYMMQMQAAQEEEDRRKRNAILIGVAAVGGIGLLVALAAGGKKGNG